MIKLFNKPKLNIYSVTVPDLDWIKEKNTTSIVQWINPDHAMALSVNFFQVKPDLPTVKNIDALRKFYRESIAQHNGGLIYVDTMELSGLTAVKTIFKIPQQPTGMTYLASCTIPFAKYSYVIKIQAPEMGITGFRDTAIADRLLKADASFSKDKGWFRDPYDSSYVGGTLMNKAEETQYDDQFPDHPLSLARKFLDKVVSDITFDEDVYKVSKFKK